MEYQIYCSICGKKYYNSRRPRYCSDTCSIEANRRDQEKRSKSNDSPRPAYLKLRFSVLHRDNFTCQYCGRSAPTVKLVVDHVIPVSSGGLTVESNLKTACEECNLGKGTTILDMRDLSS